MTNKYHSPFSSDHLVKFFKRLIVTIFSVFIGTYIYTAIGIYEYSNIDETQNADVAVVLGAAAFGDEPSPVFKERIRHSVELYRKGFVKKIIFTGGKGEKYEPPESEVAKKYALTLMQIPAEDIILETRSHTTFENLEYAKIIAESENINTYLIVSDPLHMKRSMQMAKDLGMKAYSSPTTTSKYETFFTKYDFLRREPYFYLQYQISKD